MMEKFLRNLKNIEPRKEFKEYSRALILNSPQNEYHPEISAYLSSLFTAKITLSISAAATVLIIAGLSSINSQLTGSPLASSLNQKEINKEIEAFNIQLSQVQYYEDSAKKI